MGIHASVVVPTYRRPQLLNRCLEALADQDFTPGGYEIIVADDGASLETRRLVETWARRVPEGIEVHYLPVRATRGPAAARNAGWRAARGVVVALTDDDCIPDRGWLQAGVSAITNGVAGAYGRIVVPHPDRPTDYERDAARLEKAEFATANCFYRRDLLKAVGGFDERFTSAWREDSELYFRMVKHQDERGLTLRFVHAPQAVVVHPVRPAPWGVSLRQQRKSMFNALLYKKHPALYRERLAPVTPWHYYGIVGALLALVVGGLAGRRRVALVGGGAWAALTGRFCARRLEGTSRAPRHVLEMVITSILIPPLSVFWRIWGALKYRVFFL
jgi:glycosyltransferase involved in cell wall biosynthesis